MNQEDYGVNCGSFTTQTVIHQGMLIFAQLMVVKEDSGKRLVFLSKNFSLKPQLIADLYRQRWQVALFFKWIKQHLRNKVFFGTSANAVKTQILYLSLIAS